MRVDPVIKELRADLVGKKITGVRRLTDEESDAMYWQHGGLVLILDGKFLLYPMRDEEGNGPGGLFFDPGLD